MYRATTRQISVSVQPSYLEEQSSPERDHYVWAYRVQIQNGGAETVQLLRRYWRITDGHGEVIEVEGDGVIGEQPVLEPGMAYEYVSGTPLSTPFGVMVGRYFMETKKGETFEVDIPAFSLTSPFARRVLH
jgi:ApaG protein